MMGRFKLFNFGPEMNMERRKRNRAVMIMHRIVAKLSLAAATSIMTVGLMPPARPARAAVLLLSTFNSSLNGEFSRYRQPRATADNMRLCKVGKGYAFQGMAPERALDAGYTPGCRPDAAIRYPAANLDSLCGTIEMLVRPNYSARRSDRQKIIHTLLFAPLGGRGQSLSLYYACGASDRSIPGLFFTIRIIDRTGRWHTYMARAPLRSSSGSGGVPWIKDRWYYVTASWTPTKLRLFINGKTVGGARFSPPLDAPPVSGPIVIGNSVGGGSLAGALINDLRISNVPLYRGHEAPVFPQAPLSARIGHRVVVGEGGPGMSYAPGVRQYKCYMVRTPPQLTGKLSGPIWPHLPAMSGFLMLGRTDKYAPLQTEVRMCRDRTNIYIAVLCYENHLGRLKATARPGPAGRQNRAVFDDDSVEIYLGPNYGKLPDLQIGVNSLNAHCAIMHTVNNRQHVWHGSYRTTTGRTAEGWLVETAVPYSIFGPPPKIGDVWGMRVGRNRHVGGFSCSAIDYAGNSYQDPRQFARLVMAGAAPTGRVAEQENLLNGKFIARSRAMLGAFLRGAEAQAALGRGAPSRKGGTIGALSLTARIRDAVQRFRSLLSEAKPLRVSAWDAALARAQETRVQLEKLDYLLVNADSRRAEPPPRALQGVRRENGLWYIASKQLAVAVEPRHGTIVGIWDRRTNRRLVKGAYMHYQARTRGSTVYADQLADVVRHIAVHGSRLVVTGANRALPGVKLQYAYFIRNVAGAPRRLCCRLQISGHTRRLTLLEVTSRTFFEQSYRRESWYDRIFAIGTLGDHRAYEPAAQVTRRVLERAWYNTMSGRAQFALVNPVTGVGLGEYLYKENGVWAYPQALPSSYWTPYGWDMGFAATFVNDPIYQRKPYTAELCYHLFHGDQLTFNREYLGLPAYVALRAAAPPSPLAARVAGSNGISISGHWPPDNPQRRKEAVQAQHELFRSDELAFDGWAPSDIRWPDFVAADGRAVQMHPGGAVTALKCADIRRSVRNLRQLDPDLLVGTYSFVYDIYKGSATYKKHPGWVCIGRNRRPVPGYLGGGYFRANWTPAFVDYLIRRILRMMDYYDLNVCYLDYGVCTSLADWGNGHVVTSAQGFDFIRRLQLALHKRGDLLWLNSFVGQPYCDIGYFEGLGNPNWGRADWRNQAEAYMMAKVYQPPGEPIIPLYWLGGEKYKNSSGYNLTNYIDETVGAGLMPAGCWLDPYAKAFPAPGGRTNWVAVGKYQAAVHQAAFEIQPSRWADVGLRHAWYDDSRNELETYTLGLPGNTYLVNVISHRRRAADAVIKVNLRKMGLDPAKRVFVWQFLRRAYHSYLPGHPLPANWDELFSSRICTAFVPARNAFRYSIAHLPPQRLCVTEITETPAAICSAAGIPTQVLLPAALNCSITGRVDAPNKRVVLHVVCDKRIGVVAWWPKVWGTPHLRAGAASLHGTSVVFGAEHFVRFTLKKGVWNVVLQ